MKITRDALHAAVWRTPMNKLAAELGTTAAQLVHACDALEVPRPAQGHWTLVGLGKTPDTVPLPPSPTKATASFALQPPTPRIPRLPRREAPAPRAPAATETHPLLESTRAALLAAKANERGVLALPTNRRTLDVKVTPAQRDRALDVLDKVLRIVTTVNAKVEAKRDNEGAAFTSWFLVDGEAIQFQVEERVRTDVRERTDQEMKKGGWGYFDRKETTYRPTGELTLKLLGLGGTGARQNWADSASGALETKVSDFPDGLLAGAAALKAQRTEKERREQEWADRRAREQAEAREAARQYGLIDNALQMRRQWQAARDLRAFVAAAEETIPPEARDDKFADWRELVLWYADRMDPLSTADKAKKKLCEPDRTQWMKDDELGLAMPGYRHFGHSW